MPTNLQAVIMVDIVLLRAVLEWGRGANAL